MKNWLREKYESWSDTLRYGNRVRVGFRKRNLVFVLYIGLTKQGRTSLEVWLFGRWGFGFERGHWWKSSAGVFQNTKASKDAITQWVDGLPDSGEFTASEREMYAEIFRGGA